MARWTRCSWIEGKRSVVSICSSSCFSLSEDTNTWVGYLAHFSSWYIRFSRCLGFCLFNTSHLVINAVDSSIKKSFIQTAVGMKSSGLCHWTLIAGLGKEVRGFARSGVYLFFCIYLSYSCLKGKNHVVLLLKGYTTEINLEENVVTEKLTKIYSQNTAHGFCISSELYLINCRIHPSF